MSSLMISHYIAGKLKTVSSNNQSPTYT